ncbi:MAG: S8 family serine peptidase [Candidatus Schekmanbacteria bacterium]|nr:S8 family serine peptidase [Candidatus Schekmanbacteria bacterium]
MLLAAALVALQAAGVAGELPTVPETSWPKNLPEYADGLLLVRLRPTLGAAARAGFFSHHQLTVVSTLEAIGVYQVRLGSGDSVPAARARLTADPAVEYAEPDRFNVAWSQPNDAYYGLQWHYQAAFMTLEAAWDFTQGSTDVTIGVVDNGFVYSHPDLVGRMDEVNDFDFVDCSACGCAGNCVLENDPTLGVDDEAADRGPDPSQAASSYSSHGTHVAGTMAATTNNGLGVAGINWSGRIVGARGLDAHAPSAGLTSQIITAAFYLAGIGTAYGNLSLPAKVINLSLGSQSSTCDPVWQDAIDKIVQRGTVIVASAGNSGGAVGSPANCMGVIAVSAVGQTKQLASYSSFGSQVDVAAPGGDLSMDSNGDGYRDGVLSSCFDFAGGRAAYCFFAGTSMAAPHVSGLVGLMLAKGVPAQEVEQRLKDTAVDLGPAGKDDQFGYGLIDPRAAVDYTPPDPGDGDDDDDGGDGGGGSGCFSPGRRADSAGLPGYLDALLLAAIGAANVLARTLSRRRAAPNALRACRQGPQSPRRSRYSCSSPSASSCSPLSSSSRSSTSGSS